MSQNPLNRQKARWAGRTDRRLDLENGEVITARNNPSPPLDVVVVWRSETEVGRQTGVVEWWTYPPGVTQQALQQIFDGWDMAGRPHVD